MILVFISLNVMPETVHLAIRVSNFLRALTKLHKQHDIDIFIDIFM